MSNNIDDIFSNKLEDELTKKVKLSRKKSNLKLIILGTITTLSIIILGNLLLSFLSNKYIAKNFEKDLDNISTKYQIKHPNEYISEQKYLETGYFQFQNYYTISKKIGGKLLLSDLVSKPGGLSKNNAFGKSNFISEAFPQINSNLNSRPNSPYGLRSLIFMYPYVNYPNTINDFELLSDMDESKTLEMSLCFDKEYDYNQVNQLIDSDLITFYWINTKDSDDNVSYNIQNNAYTTEDSVMGIKSTFYNGSTLTDTDDRLSKFKDSINYFKDNPAPDINTDIDLDNLKISGVVVVGSPNQLLSLKNNSMIKHSILGNVVDKY